MAEEKHEEEIQRFTTSQVIQHAVWAIVFLTLLITGLALKFPDNFASRAVIGILGWEGRAIIHRIAAVLFILTAFAHGIYYGVIDRSTPLLKRALIPTRKDLSDFVQDVKYHLRMTNEKPKFGRYTWYEKLDYWAGVGGFFIITITGLTMFLSYGSVVAGLQWLGVLSWVPLNIYNWFRMIHGFEAILAGLFIVIVHFYFTIWRPGTFPIAKQIWTGKMPRHHYEEEHPLELEEIEAKMSSKSE